MRVRTKSGNRGGRPREFNESDALKRMQRQLWTTGLSGTFLDGIARSAGLNRPSPPRATKPGHRPYLSGPRGERRSWALCFIGHLEAPVAQLSLPVMTSSAAGKCYGEAAYLQQTNAAYIRATR